MTDAALDETGMNGSGSAIHDSRQSSLIRSMTRDPRAWIGGAAVLIVVLVALIGPYLAPQDPADYVGKVYAGASPAYPLGTDVLGRDVLSRLLVGGRTFLFEGVTAAVLGVGLGVLIGMILGSSSGAVLAATRFTTDTLMLIPQILLVLLIITAFGANTLSLIGAVAAAQVIYTARVVAAATQKVVEEDYYQAAQTLGMRKLVLLRREVLPNIAGVVLVEFGVRLSVCFIALASLSYLGFGSTAVEWGSMIHDSQGGITLQPLAVLAPVGAIGVFLLGMNMLRDAFARALSERTAL